MQCVIIPISKCIPGMVTAQPIIDIKTGTIIIAENQELTAEHISNMQKFYYTDIWVYVDSFKNVWNLPEETIENYKKFSTILLSAIKNVTDSESPNITEFENLCRDIPLTLKHNYEILGCTNLVEQLDCNTYTHSVNVACIAMLICRWNNLGDEMIAKALKAGLLHDVGLSKVSFDAFDSSIKRTAEQQAEYQKHPIYSYDIVRLNKEFEPDIAKAILAHHECCDGTGFPVRVSGPYISQLSKVIALADAFDLLRREHHVFDTIELLLKDYLTKFDPKLLLSFCSNIVAYYIGSFVELNSMQIAKVVFINPVKVSRPIVKINNTFINLYEHPELRIMSVK